MTLKTVTEGDMSPPDESEAIDLTNPPAEEPEQLENVVDIRTKNLFAASVTKGNAITHDRWLGEYVPWAYELSSEGIAKAATDQKGPEKFAGPIHVLAQTSSPDGTDGGLVLEIETMTGAFQTIPIPRTRLHEDPCILARDLSNLNFQIRPGKEKDLLVYLGDCVPSTRKLASTQTGWAAAPDPEKLVYILPNSATDPGYNFQPERYSASAMSCRPAGTLKDWIENVFDPAPYPLLAVLAALSAPLLKFSGQSTGGLHFYGESSCGKTTLAQMAASVAGNGADPGDAPANPYTKRWNTTLNALEGLAVAHNDMPLVMDELGSVDGRNYSRMIYDLSGGQGKSAMDQSRNLRKQRSWRTVLISTGEISSLTKLEESTFGKKGQAKAGQLIRLIDIAVKPTMFRSRQSVDKIKRNCAVYYGTMLPAFVEALAGHFKATKLSATIQVQMDKTLARLNELYGPFSAIQERALKFFALCEVTGCLIVYLKLIPGLTIDQVQNCINTVVRDWAPASQGLSDTERAIVNLREYILKYKDSRFKSSFEATGADKQQIAGYYDGARGAFMMLPEAFREATGCELAVVAKALQDRGMLVPSDEKHKLTCRITIGTSKIRIRTYGINEMLLVKDRDDGKAD